MNEQNRIEETWREVGIKARPLRSMVFVRTELRPEFEGSIYIPPAQRTNYAGLANTVFMRAVVLSTGPDCKVLVPGNRVQFSRLFFARWKDCEDGTLVGWVSEENIWLEEKTEP